MKGASEVEVMALHNEIGVPCLDPSCPHCPPFWALVERIRSGEPSSEILPQFERWEVEASRGR